MTATGVDESLCPIFTNASLIHPFSTDKRLPLGVSFFPKTAPGLKLA